MVRKFKIATKGSGGREENNDDKTDEKEAARVGEQDKKNSTNADGRNMWEWRGQAEKRGVQQEIRNDSSKLDEKAEIKGKSPTGKTTGKGNGAKAEIKRALSSHRYKGNVRLWLLQEHLTSSAFDIHRLYPGIISKLGDGRCWRGEGEGFPGELCVFGARRDVVRIVCVEVGGDAKTTNAVVLAAFPVKDHPKYKSYLGRLRSNPQIMKEAIFSCQNAWGERITTELVNGPNVYGSRAMGKQEATGDGANKPTNRWSGV